MKIFFLTFLLMCATIPSHADEVLVSISGFRSWYYQVKGEFVVDQPPKIAWEVLSDYEGIATFVPSIKLSHIESQDSSGILLQQKISERLWFFYQGMSVLLKVNETPIEEIRFEDTSHDDFHLYKGFWRIEPAQTGAHVTYFLEVSSNFSLPVFFTKGFLKKSAEDLLQQVQKEIKRRGALHR